MLPDLQRRSFRAPRTSPPLLSFRNLEYTFLTMERGSTPSLLPILRSQQQAELLARLLGRPDDVASLTDLAADLDMPVSSVYREIERAEAAGLVTSRKVGNTRLVQANIDSPYYAGLADVLVKAFGPPHVISSAIADVGGIESAYIYGSWAARFAGTDGDRPVGDIDLLVLGSPDRDELYAALSSAEERLGRPIQVSIRAADWLSTGTGNFHATVTQRPLVPVATTREQTASLARSH